MDNRNGLCRRNLLETGEVIVAEYRLISKAKNATNFQFYGWRILISAWEMGCDSETSYPLLEPIPKLTPFARRQIQLVYELV